MRTRIWLFAALVGALGLGDQNRAPGSGTPADPRAFDAPSDGRLTDEHVRTYLSIQRATPASPDEPGSAAPPIMIERIAGRFARELSAARRLGVGEDEYRWIRARIAEARAGARPGGEDALLAAIEAQVKAGGARVRREADVEEEARPIPAASEAAIAHNRELLQKYRDQLDAVSAQGR